LGHGEGKSREFAAEQIKTVALKTLKLRPFIRFIGEKLLIIVISRLFASKKSKMTITYSLDVASSTFLGIHRLLLRWKGSIWKSIWPELLCWLGAYFGLSLCYRFVMDEEQKM